MDLRYSIGVLQAVWPGVVFAIFFVGGRPTSPMSPDGWYGPALAGVGAAVFVVNSLLLLEFQGGVRLDDGERLLAIPLALPIAFGLNAFWPLLDVVSGGSGIAVETVGLAAGATALYFPVVTAFAAGRMPERAAEIVAAAAGVFVVGLLLVVEFHPGGAIEVESAVRGIVATGLVILVTGALLYGLGRAVEGRLAPGAPDRSHQPGVLRQRR